MGVKKKKKKKRTLLQETAIDPDGMFEFTVII